MHPDRPSTSPREAGGPSPRRNARLAGAVGAVVTLAVLSVLSAARPTIPFPPTALAEAAIRATPGDIATFFIELQVCTIPGWRTAEAKALW